LAAEEHLLGAWADAFERGDRERAAGLLDAVAAVGLALRERTGDSMLADTAAAIAAASSGNSMLLARGHRSFQQGSDLFKLGSFAARARSSPRRPKTCG
jgi:hypothetical protein